MAGKAVHYVAAFNIQSDRSNFAFSSLQDDRIFTTSCPSTLLLNPDTSEHSFGYQAEEFVAASLDHGDDITNHYFFRNLKCLHTLEPKVADEDGNIIHTKTVMSRIIQHFLQEMNGYRMFSMANHDDLCSDVFLVFILSGINFSRMAELIRESAATLGIHNSMVEFIPDAIATVEFCEDEERRQVNGDWSTYPPSVKNDPPCNYKEKDDWSTDPPSVKTDSRYKGNDPSHFGKAESNFQTGPGKQKIVVLRIGADYSEISIVHNRCIEAMKRKSHERVFDVLLKYLTETLGIDDISKLQKENYTAFLEMLLLFERSRIQANSNKPLNMKIELPSIFFATNEIRTGDDFPQKRSLSLTTEVIEDIYKSTFQSAVSLFLSIAKLVSENDKVVITGEFADALVVDKLNETFREKCDCDVVPIENPSVCALYGALLLGKKCLKAGCYLEEEVTEIFTYTVTDSRGENDVRNSQRGLNEVKHESFTSLLLERHFGKVKGKILTFSTDGTLLSVKKDVRCVGANWQSRHRYYTLESLDLAIEHSFLDCSTHIKFEFVFPNRTLPNISKICAYDSELSLVSSQVKEFRSEISFEIWQMWMLEKCDNTIEEIVKFAISSSSESVKRFVVKLLIARKFEYESVTRSIFNTKDSIMIQCILWLCAASLYRKYESSNSVEEIWPGYYCNEGENPYCIVFVHSDNTKERPGKFWGVSIHCRHENTVSSEAQEVMMYEQKLLSTMRTVRDFHEDYGVNGIFNSHSNLVMISHSKIKSSGYSDKSLKVILEPCIVFYCRIKGVVPIKEQRFPTILNSYKVDVREAFCIRTADKRSLRMGDSIRSRNLESYGTIGGFVDLPQGGIGAITCAHVVCPEYVLSKATQEQTTECIADYLEEHNIEITCPPQTKTLGTVEKMAFYVNKDGNTSVDAALIKLSSRHPLDGRFREYTEEELMRTGYNLNDQPTFNTGETITVSPENCRYTLIKFGAVSGITKGLFQLSRSHAKFTTKLVTKENSCLRFTMHNQYEVQPVLDDSKDLTEQHFATSGDSGSLVFMQMPDTNALKCCGMVVATTSYGSCLMTPIENVLVDLGLSARNLKRFHLPDESPSGSQDSVLSPTDRILLSIKEKVDVIPSLKENVDAIPRLTNRVERMDVDLQDTRDRVGNIERHSVGYTCDIL